MNCITWIIQCEQQYSNNCMYAYIYNIRKLHTVINNNKIQNNENNKNRHFQ